MYFKIYKVHIIYVLYYIKYIYTYFILYFIIILTSVYRYTSAVEHKAGNVAFLPLLQPDAAGPSV